MHTFDVLFLVNIPPFFLTAELPLEFPDGTTPVTCRVSIYDGSADKKVGVGSLFDKAIAPSLPIGSLYMEEVHAKVWLFPLKLWCFFGSTILSQHSEYSTRSSFISKVFWLTKKKFYLFFFIIFIPQLLGLTELSYICLSAWRGITFYCWGPAYSFWRITTGNIHMHCGFLYCVAKWFLLFRTYFISSYLS